MNSINILTEDSKNTIAERESLKHLYFQKPKEKYLPVAAISNLEFTTSLDDFKHPEESQVLVALTFKY